MPYRAVLLLVAPIVAALPAVAADPPRRSPPTGSRPTSRTWRATGSKAAAPAPAARNSPPSTSRPSSRRPASSRSASAARTSSPSRSCASSPARSPRSGRRRATTTLDIPCEEDFSGTSQTQTELEEFDAEAVFVGHGITAPEFGWDDYKGVDVKGKVVVLFTNEPPSDDPKFFGGTALTYYGRWTFKFEEAARRGAKACFIIHTDGDGRLPVLRRPAARRRAAQARARPARAGLRRLAHPRGGREAPGPVRPDGGRGAEGGRHEGVQAVLARRQPEGQHPDPRREDRQQQRRRHGRGQRPGAEVGGGRLHGPLGPPRRRPGRPRRRDLQRRGGQRHRLRPAARTGPRLGGPVAEAEAVRPLPRRHRGGEGAARLEVLRPATRSSRWARRRSTSTST